MVATADQAHVQTVARALDVATRHYRGAQA